MSLVTPQYVQGKYTVAQRDAILDKANSYPGAAAGLANQVPTLFPDGTIQWKQVPSGESGTANANIAVVEASSQASKDYAVGDLLVYNGQLYKVTAFIETDDAITPGTNVTPTTVETWTDGVVSDAATTVAGNLATVEASSTASKAYAAGEYLVYHYQLYKASTAIAQGDTLEVGTNIALAIYSEDVAAALDERTPLIGKGINLLDNWYFPNPVNQRGNNSYNTNDAYTIDRWKFYTSASAPLYVLSTGLKLDATAISAGAPYAKQIVEDYNCIPGKTYTFSALAVDGSNVSGAIWYLRVQATVNGTLQNLAASVNTELGLKSVTFTIPSGASGLSVQIGVYSTRFVTVSAAKLELGDTQTLAREVNGSWVLNDPAPNYQQELAKCQRYYVSLKPRASGTPLIGVGIVVSSTLAAVFIPLPVTLNGESVTLAKSGTVKLWHGSVVGASAVDVSGFLSSAVSGNSVTVTVSVSSGLNLGEVCAIQFRSEDAVLSISCEL